MMQEKEFQGHVTAAKTTLEHTAAQGRNFAPMVMVIRDGRMVAQIIPGEGDGAIVAKTARVAAASFGADELLLVNDTYMADGPDRLNPVTGREWQHGDMEDLVHNHDGIAKGWVTEALMVLVTGRDQPDHMASLPYVRHPDGTVTWSPDGHDLVDGRGGQEHIPGGRFTGLFDGLTLDMRVPDPIAALVLGRMDAMVALAFFEDETDPVMLALKSDIESGKLRTR